LRTMLWYEELFLLLLRAPAGRFEILCEGIAIEGELGSREQRRTIWWSSVRKLSQIEGGRRASFLQAARTRFGVDVNRDADGDDSPSCRRYGLLTCNELRQLVSAGMTVGAHTLSHPMLSQLSPDLAYTEISESQAKLEVALQERIWAFAYPFGDPQSVTPQILEMPERAGYKAAFLNFGGGLGIDLPPYALPRLHVTDGMTLGELDAHVSGFYMRLQRRARRGSDGVGLAKDPVQ
jgi:hypothetical protein